MPLILDLELHCDKVKLKKRSVLLNVPKNCLEKLQLLEKCALSFSSLTVDLQQFHVVCIVYPTQTECRRLQLRTSFNILKSWPSAASATHRPRDSASLPRSSKPASVEVRFDCKGIRNVSSNYSIIIRIKCLLATA